MVSQDLPGNQHESLKIAVSVPEGCAQLERWCHAARTPINFAELDFIVVIDVFVWLIISSMATPTLWIYPDSRW